MKITEKDFLLKGALIKVMWKLSLPAIAAMVLFGLNAFMDTVYIGQLMNSTALAGVAIAYPLTSIMLGLGSWAGMGAGNLLSIVLGKNDVVQEQKIMSNTTLFVIFLSFIFMLPLYAYAKEMIYFLGGRGDVLLYGTEYFKVTLLASPIWVYGLSLNFIVRAEGKMKAAAIMMVYGLVINLILTPIFINFYDMGVSGAAWATNIGMLAYSIAGYLYFRTGKASFKSNIHSLSFDKAVFQSIVKLGLPGFILTLMNLVQAVVVFNAIVRVGTENDLAFFAAANRILLFLVTPIFGLMRAFQPVAGVNFGAGEYQRVKDSFFLFIKTGFYIILPFWILLLVFPESSLRLVLPQMPFDSADLWYFRIYMLILPFIPFVYISFTYLPAIGRPKWASIIGLARQVIFYVPVMLFLPKLLGISGIYYGATAIDLLITLWLLYIVRQTFKSYEYKKNKI